MRLVCTNVESTYFVSTSDTESGVKYLPCGSIDMLKPEGCEQKDGGRKLHNSCVPYGERSKEDPGTRVRGTTINLSLAHVS